MHRLPAENNYYLQVIKEGEEPEWTDDTSELVVGNQIIEDSFIQYWAYPKDSGLKRTEIPQAEKLAQQNKTSVPAVLINQEDKSIINLVLVKDGHAWAKLDSNIDELEESLNSIVGVGQKKYGFKIEHFMTSENVTKEVEAKLNNIEQNIDNEDSLETKPISNKDDIDTNSISSSGSETISSEENNNSDQSTNKNLNSFKDSSSDINSEIYLNSSHNEGNSSSSPVITIILIIILVILVGGSVAFRKQILSFISTGKIPSMPSFLNNISKGNKPTPTMSTPTPTPTPTPNPINRSNYSIEVLNGTTKAGAAGNLSDYLKGLGWNISKVGNAPESNTSQTLIKVPVGKENIAKQLIKDIANQYEATYSATLSVSNIDAEIIIGNK